MAELKALFFTGKTSFHSKAAMKVMGLKENSADFECLVSKKMETICLDFDVTFLSLC